MSAQSEIYRKAYALVYVVRAHGNREKQPVLAAAADELADALDDGYAGQVVDQAEQDRDPDEVRAAHRTHDRAVQADHDPATVYDDRSAAGIAGGDDSGWTCAECEPGEIATAVKRTILVHLNVELREDDPRTAGQIGAIIESAVKVGFEIDRDGLADMTVTLVEEV